jgi:hypothetical protein
MIKSLFFLAALAACALNLYGDLKDYTVIVKSTIHQKTQERFLDIAGYFDKKNESSLGDIFRSFAKGFHGSGFIILDKNGNNFIITNAHVVAPAESVEIELENPDGTRKTFGGNVIYINDELDLAILEFADKEKVSKKGLAIARDAVLEDGDEVWSAGFPGLIGKPAWQLARGNITNKKAFVDEIMDSKKSYIIQHSASIDPGNSGGPLLIKDTTSVSGYRVVGINTWSVGSRQNTFFALPASHVSKILFQGKETERLNSDPTARKELLVKSCTNLASEIGSAKPKVQSIARFISYEFVARKGWDSFISVIKASSREEETEWERSFFMYSPVETMRAAIYSQIYSNLHKDDSSRIEFDSINSTDDESFGYLTNIRTTFTVSNAKKEIVWKFEKGRWCIIDMNLETVQSAPQRGNELGFLQLSGIASVKTNIGMISDICFGVSAELNFFSLFKISLGAQYLASILPDNKYVLARLPLTLGLILMDSDRTKGDLVLEAGVVTYGYLPSDSGSESFYTLGVLISGRREYSIVFNRIHAGFFMALEFQFYNSIASNLITTQGALSIFVVQLGIFVSYLP